MTKNKQTKNKVNKETTDDIQNAIDNILEDLTGYTSKEICKIINEVMAVKLLKFDNCKNCEHLQQKIKELESDNDELRNENVK